MFFFLLEARPKESKLAVCQRLVQHLECDARVRGELDRRSSTLHLDIDDSDPKDLLRQLRRSFGLLRAFKWDSKGSLLLQLSDLLLGIARADRDGSLDALDDSASEAKKRKKEILEHARRVAHKKAERRKIGRVLQMDEQGNVTECLLRKREGTMALVKCAECGNNVSTAATASPKCGAPVATIAIGTPLSTIQQTSKRLKLHIILSSLEFWIGLIWACVVAYSAPDIAEAGPALILPLILILVGFVWYLVTKFRIWWHHK